MAKPTLTDVSGIGEATAAQLVRAGIYAVDDLAQASSASLSTIPGFGPARAAKVCDAARALLRAAESGPEGKPAPAGKDKKSKKKKREKKKREKGGKKKDRTGKKDKKGKAGKRDKGKKKKDKKKKKKKKKNKNR